MAVGMLLVAFAVRAALIPTQNDTFWHLRAGGDIWRTGQVPRTETWSYTAFGAPWPDHEWLWQLYAHACHALGGLPLVTLGSALLLFGALLLVHGLMRGPASTRFLVMAVGFAMSSCVWVLRPQIVTLAAMPVLATLLVRERYWPIPLLFLVWANAHAGVSLGGLVLVGAAAAAFLRWRILRGADDHRRALSLAVVLPLAAVATMATPLGAGIFGFVWRSTTRIHALGIDEWQPTLPTAPLEATFGACTLALVVLAVKRRRAFLPAGGGAMASWGDWALAAGALALMPLAFRSVRNIGPFLLLAVPLASRLLAQNPPRVPHLPAMSSDRQSRSSLDALARHRLLPERFRRREASPDHPRFNLALLAGVALLAAGAIAAAYRTGFARLGWHPVAPGAIAAVRGCDGPLYNTYNEGGFLLWFAPERPVFADSRQDPYPLPFLLDLLAVERAQAPYRPLFERWGIRCAFLADGSPTIAALTRDGWATRYADRAFTVLAAPAAHSQPASTNLPANATGKRTPP
jgi:hypothetical protein